MRTSLAQLDEDVADRLRHHPQPEALAEIKIRWELRTPRLKFRSALCASGYFAARQLVPRWFVQEAPPR
jgi:hypothetical protein